MVQVTVVISRTEYEELLAQNARLAQVLANWLKQIRLANKRRFGRSSKQSRYDDGSEQLRMDFCKSPTSVIE